MLDTPDPPLDVFAKQLHGYLAGTLHADIEIESWPADPELPVFLARRYTFYRTTIAFRNCLFMAPTGAEPTPVELTKHMAQIARVTDDVLAYATPRMSAATRGRLIALGVPFAVPGNQLYLPQLAMDLREHYRAPDKAHGDRLTPAAQIVLFHHLVGRHRTTTPSELARLLPYTPMTLGRAFDELAAHGLATVARDGREKTIAYPTEPRILLEFAKTLLRTPRRGYHAVRFTQTKPPLLRAGETALADLTKLAPPATPVYAIDGTDWRGFFIKHGIKDLDEIEGADAMIETWYYDPGLLAERGRVDAPSLFAQYWNDPDERVVQAALDLLEVLP